MNYIRRISRGWLIFLIIAVVLSIIGCIKAKPQLIKKISPDSFAVVILPDTQFYSKRYPDTYYEQTQWIVDNKDTLNIKFAIHLGDITHDNIPEQWEVADKAHRTLDGADVPYSMIPGNHDMPEMGRFRDTSRYNKYFGPERFLGKKWYGGHMGITNDNNYTFFEWTNLRFMVVSLEYAPTDEALTWAYKLIEQYKDRRVIVVTHCFQTKGGRHKKDCATAYNLEGNGAHTVWQELISKHRNIFMVLSGHVTGVKHKIRRGDAGNEVHEILTDYQDERAELDGIKSGNGWMRILQFNPNENKIHVSSLSVDGVKRFYETDRYNRDPAHSDHAFSFHYDMKTRI
ncbi:MAG: metallophosphoesterase [Desulfobacterales bacterium]|nr:metallophosphoesterase [Desulfobacterales bacterium]